MLLSFRSNFSSESYQPLRHVTATAWSSPRTWAWRNLKHDAETPLWTDGRWFNLIVQNTVIGQNEKTAQHSTFWDATGCCRRQFVTWRNCKHTGDDRHSNATWAVFRSRLWLRNCHKRCSDYYTVAECWLWISACLLLWLHCTRTVTRELVYMYTCRYILTTKYLKIGEHVHKFVMLLLYPIY